MARFTSGEGGLPRAPRYALRMPLRYRRAGDIFWNEGTTENISRSGILFRAPELLEPATPVEFTFLLPMSFSGREGASVSCGGLIVRAVQPESAEEFPTLAVKISSYRLEQAADRPRTVTTSLDARLHAESGLRLLLTQLPGALWATDEGLRLTSAVGSGLPGLDLAAADFMGRKLSEIFQTGDPRSMVTSAHLDALTGEPVTYELEWSGRWYHAHAEPLRDARGHVVGTLGLAFDISERKRLEDSLIRAEEKFAKAFRATPDAISISTLDEGRYVEVNDSFLRLTGYERHEVVGRTVVELNIWADPGDLERMNAQIRMLGAVRDMELRYRNREGALRAGSLSAEVIELAGERCLVSVMRDISEHRLLEEQLLQAQKMEAIGRLAGGVAHDFNNLLAIILGYSDLLQDTLPAEGPARKHLAEVRKAGDRAATLTRQLVAFSRKQVLELKVFDLNAVVIENYKMLRRLIGEDIELRLEPDSQPTPVKADAAQMEQVIMNLAVNARDAMPRGGRLTVETANVRLDATQVNRHVTMPAGAYVMLAVTDNGMGMDANTQARIFEPFFTTKEKGKGTGLGLATVYGIVKQSGGYIWVYSEPGQGTTFKIYLPRAEEPIQPEPVAARLPAASLRGNETVLLVEDEESVRKLAAHCLREQGYTVLEASQGTEALQLCRERADPIHLLVTDVVMPGMGGRDLADQLIALRPDARVLFVSGYTGNAIVHHGILDPGTFLLSKPFRPLDLAQKVREVLDAGTEKQR
ncbi:MAG: PAS domain S-box protein [Acidobacteria bacterium]|nr:PAS domain S-box protein [Acidobacteriota bacterium]